MKTCFLYDGPHPVHAEWARSIDAEFISNTLTGKIKIPNISRLIKTLSIVGQIPEDIDLLLCESGAEIIAGAIWKRKNPEKKLVLIVSDPKLYYLPAMLSIKKKVYLRAMSFYDMFIHTSPLMQSLVPKNLRNRSRMVYPYVDIGHYSSKKTDLDSKNIVFVGRVGMEKGVDRIVNVFEMLRKEFPGSKLYIVGEGPLKKELEKNEDIVFTGRVEDPIKFLLKASIYMNLGRIEPAGIAVLEAMCAGLVPIVSEGVGLADFIRKVSPDLIVQDVEGAASTVRKIWNSPELREKYSSRGISVSKQFTKENSIKQFKEAITRVQVDGK